MASILHNPAIWTNSTVVGEGNHMTTAFAQPGYMAKKLYETARK